MSSVPVIVGRVMVYRLFTFPALVVVRCMTALGLTHEQKESRQTLLTSQLCILARRLRVSRLLRSERPSLRWSSGRVGLKSCFAQLANPVPFGQRVALVGFAVVAGAVTNVTASVIPDVPGVEFGHVVPQPPLSWWLCEFSIQACIIITLFWIAWVVSGDRKK